MERGQSQCTEGIAFQASWDSNNYRILTYIAEKNPYPRRLFPNRSAHLGSRRCEVYSPKCVRGNGCARRNPWFPVSLWIQHRLNSSNLKPRNICPNLPRTNLKHLFLWLRRARKTFIAFEIQHLYGAIPIKS